MINKKNILGVIFLIFCGHTMANNVSGNFQSQATLNASCTVAVNNFSFGNITAATTGTASVINMASVLCSKGVAYKIAINAGNSGDVMQRQMVGMAGNTDKLNYNIYYRIGRNQFIWGDIASSSAESQIGIDGTEFAPIYSPGEVVLWEMTAKLPLNQYVKPDTYSDSLTVSIIY